MDKKVKKESNLYQISYDVIQEWIFCHFDHKFLLKTFCLVCKEYKNLVYSDLTWELMMKRILYKPSLSRLSNIINKYKTKKDGFKALFRIHKTILFIEEKNNEYFPWCGIRISNIEIINMFDLYSLDQITDLSMLFSRTYHYSPISYISDVHCSFYDIGTEEFKKYPIFYDKNMIFHINRDIYKGEFEFDRKEGKFVRHGNGIWFYKNGTRKELKYKNGTAEEKAIKYFPDGKIFEFNYKNGKVRMLKRVK